MRSILLTNDDGITSDGLVRLAEAAKEFGEVWVVAPEGQRSAASHGITLRKSIDVNPYSFPVEGVRAYSCSGTPADCVRSGSLFLMPGRPDVVLSGINRGYNVATDIPYSGTVGAAFEGVFHGSHAIAFSEEACDCHEVTDGFLRDILARLLEERPGAGRIWNVNFPGCPLSECRGILENRQVSRKVPYWDCYREVEQLEGGGFRLIVQGLRRLEAEEGSDYRAVLDRWVSIGTVNNLGYPL